MPPAPSSPTRRAPLIAALVILAALAAHLPSLGWGFSYDDFIHQYLLRHAMDWPDAGPWKLYDFSFWTRTAAENHTAVLTPWWVSPDFKVSFFRPVSSLSLWLDHRLFNAWAPGYHLTNLALFAALCALAWRLYGELGAPPRAAAWALAFFALDDNHALPVDWIANRNELLSSLFVVAMVFNMARQHRLGGAGRLAAAWACFLCACLSKESGLIGLPLAGLYVFALGGPGAQEGFRSRCLRVLRSPAVWLIGATALLYLGWYVTSGHGSFSSNYATPWHRTGVYLGRVASLFPLATGSLFFGLSTDMIFTRPHALAPVLALSSVLFAWLLWLFWRRLRALPLAWFAAGWAVAALLPMAGVTLSDRLLMSASIGSSLTLGLLVDQAGCLRGVLANLRARWPVLVFVVLGLVIAAPVTVLRGRMFHRMAAADRDATTAADIERTADGARVFLVNSPSTLLAMMIGPTWAVMKDDPDTAIHALNIARRPVRLRRDDERTLVMTAGDPPLLDHRYERVFHTSEAPPAAGTVFTTDAFAATVLATESNGIRSVRLSFREPLDSPSFRFLAWQDGGYRRIAPPRVGEEMVIPCPAPTVPWAP